MTIDDVSENYMQELKEVYGLSNYEIYKLIKEALL